MTQTVTIQLEMPQGLETFSLPPGVDNRLQTLLDKRDQRGCLTDQEREEAEGLVNLADMLSVLKLSATIAAQEA